VNYILNIDPKDAKCQNIWTSATLIWIIEEVMAAGEKGWDFTLSRVIFLFY